MRLPAAAAVLLSTSEFRVPQFTTGTGPSNNGGNCTKAVVALGGGRFQLQLNSELYEGLRYGWIHVVPAPPPGYFGSILMDRGDRISWTGDAHLAQKAALAGFGGDVGTEMVYQNLLRTRGNDNGVISCDMYFVLSVVDYYLHSGDHTGLAAFSQDVNSKLKTSVAFWAKPSPQHFIGSDERIGADFDDSTTSSAAEKTSVYKMLSTQAVME